MTVTYLFIIITTDIFRFPINSLSLAHSKSRANITRTVALPLFPSFRLPIIPALSHSPSTPYLTDLNHTPPFPAPSHSLYDTKMPTTIPFFIPDTSPIFTYTSTSSSLSNTFNPTSTSSLSSGGTNSVDATGAEVDEDGAWIAAYSPIGNGYDQTFHYGQGVISGNFSGASIIRPPTFISHTQKMLMENGMERDK